MLKGLSGFDYIPHEDPEQLLTLGEVLSSMEAGMFLRVKACMNEAYNQN